MAHPCLTFSNYHEKWCKTRLKTITKKREKANYYYWEPTLRQVNQWDRFDSMVPLYWKRVFAQQRTPIKEYTLEFLSTFRFHNPRADTFEEGAITYRINGVQQSSSIAWFGVNLGIYSERELERDYCNGHHLGRTFPDEEEHEPTGGAIRKAFWEKIGTGDTYNASSTKSTGIRDPLLRYIHRMLSHGITGRGQSTGVVTLRDLWCLYCIVNNQYCDIAYQFALLFDRNATAEKSTPIVGASWIANIYANHDQRMEGTPGLVPMPLDINVCNHMGMVIRVSDSGDRFRDADGNVWDPNEPEDISLDLDVVDPENLGRGGGDRHDGGARNETGGSSRGTGAGRHGTGGGASSSRDPDFPTMLDIYEAVESASLESRKQYMQMDERMKSMEENVTYLRNQWDLHYPSHPPPQ